MSRGIVVLDENLLSLETHLQKRNMRVIKPIAGMTDDTIAEALASGRVLITNNSKDFLQLAIDFEFGIIATEKGPADDASLAKAISSAITAHSLWAKKGAFVTTLKKDGTSTFKELKD